MSTLKLKNGKTVIAECPHTEVDKMVKLVKELNVIRNDDSKWEFGEVTVGNNIEVRLIAHSFLDEIIMNSEIKEKNLKMFPDAFDNLTLWNHSDNGDKVKTHRFWTRGF
tara:strand:+ start:54 stop:380 length:327 start_codon:yes stop_codon:yes gene_type:complete